MGYTMLIVEPGASGRPARPKKGSRPGTAWSTLPTASSPRGLRKMAESLRRDEEGARIQIRGGKSTLVDGPFAEAEEIGRRHLSPGLRDQGKEALAIARECPPPSGRPSKCGRSAPALCE